MNFIVKEFDPFEDAIQRFQKHNATPADQREHSETELMQLIVHAIKQHDGR